MIVGLLCLFFGSLFTDYWKSRSHTRTAVTMSLRYGYIVLLWVDFFLSILSSCSYRES